MTLEEVTAIEKRLHRLAIGGDKEAATKYADQGSSAGIGRGTNRPKTGPTLFL